MTVSELKATMSATEFELWKLYDEVKHKLQEDAMRKERHKAKFQARSR